MAERLTEENLFVLRPQNPDVSEETVFDQELLDKASNQDLLSCTYTLLKGQKLSKAEALTLWELRLVLLMFGNQLAAARREAVNLNNALYLSENPTAAPPQQSIPRPQIGRSDSTASRRSGSSPGPNAPGNVVYPFPKNNDGAIGFSLLSLILRLKSAPNLSLVNELYKLCYQLRLKGSSGEEAEIQRNLISLSYEIIMALMITRNFYTLLSFVESLEAGVKAREDSSSEEYLHYSSNVSLTIVLANMIIRQSEGIDDFDVAELRQRFENLDQFTLDCFVNVLRKYSPMVGESGGPSVGSDEDVDYDKLLELVKQGKLTGRIVCSTLASFELGNMYRAEFQEVDKDKRLAANPAPHTGTRFENVYTKVMSQWGNYIEKVYGLE
ncbi:hypothetical protein FT663_00736 [Candidozyma haemuli var. vulneris]|uniref:Uncharacterized protein n=1 Tax=Candidozyma haemuli TaxID=45357 RepID=A0A2V1AS92_9ASCO|nr:hypothetical protein CXQ85_003669 [[Candida] haemuloni]KAF3992456.1 hypothetical protein FT662_01165 [[Candida] haemuloni var. vulneris]KAF3995193.1 hypothetical protein FT663_00736 [[Candida] haemuloni var. vulneris]PVH19811.1 hypothetical protein CXQ85_003669 [[Candida] haemuloni]